MDAVLAENSMARSSRKAASNGTAVRTGTEPRDEASGLVFSLGRIRRDATRRTPSRPPLTPAWPSRRCGSARPRGALPLAYALQIAVVPAEKQEDATVQLNPKSEDTNVLPPA
jgi:hypothetical protein